MFPANQKLWFCIRKYAKQRILLQYIQMKTSKVHLMFKNTTDLDLF